MPLQSSIPDTSTYMIAGYAVFAIIMAVYLLSLVVRQRNLEQDLTTLESLQEESRRVAPRRAAAPRAKSRGSRKAVGRKGAKTPANRKR
jgi:hypothetical protein